MKYIFISSLLFISISAYSQKINVNATATERKYTNQGTEIINTEVTQQNVKIIINDKNLTIGSSTYPIVAIAKKKDGYGFQIYYKYVSSTGSYEFSIKMVTYNTLYENELSSRLSPTMEYTWTWD